MLKKKALLFPILSVATSRKRNVAVLAVLPTTMLKMGLTHVKGAKNLEKRKKGVQSHGRKRNELALHNGENPQVLLMEQRWKSNSVRFFGGGELKSRPCLAPLQPI